MANQSAVPESDAPHSVAVNRAAAPSPEGIAILLVGCAIACGAMLRFLPALVSDFPLNDGGMFYIMARELQRAHFDLPYFTAYNAAPGGASIPFAYPPLGFYLAAALSSLTGCSILALLQYLPPLASSLAIPAFYLLGLTLLKSRKQAVLATFAFALLPRDFAWMIMGGGLTRAPAFVFALLALQQTYYLVTTRERRYIVTTSLLAALTVLTHAELAYFLIYSAMLFCAFWGRDRANIARVLGVVAGTAALSAPWWALVLARHGMSPFLAAAGTGRGDWFSWSSLLGFNFTSETYLPLLAATGLLGIFACLAEKRWLLPVWLVAIFFVQPRSSLVYSMVPLSLLIGIALDRLILPQLQTLRGQIAATANRGRDPLNALVLACYFLFAFMSAFAISSGAAQLRPLPPGERAAMEWVATNTPPNEKFLVLAGSGVGGSAGWAQDCSAEWFPALAQRVSVATVQGSEWLPGRFYTLHANAEQLQSCAYSDEACLARWAVRENVSYDAVYVAKPQLAKSSNAMPEKPYASVERSLRKSTRYIPIFENSCAVIFALNKISRG